LNNDKAGLPDQTLETLVRNFFRESTNYGFKQLDYVRFVNLLLDLSMEPHGEDLDDSSDDEQSAVPLYAKNDDNFMSLPIESDRIRIRKLDPSVDMEIMHQWLEDKYGRQFLLSRITAQTLDLEKIVNDCWNIFGIVTTHDDIPIGCMAYLGFNSDQKKAELRKLIGNPAMRGKGYAKEATQLWIRYGINALKLKKIHLSTLHTDLRNLRLNEDLGFKIEGILRNEICVDGTYHDVLRMSLWNE